MSSRPSTAMGGGGAVQQAAGEGFTRRDLVGHRAAVTAVAWSENGRRLATASEDGRVLVWMDVDANWVTSSSSRSDKKPDCDIQLSSKEVITALAFNPKREEMLAVVGSNVTRVYEINRKGAAVVSSEVSTPEAIAAAWDKADGLVVAQLNNTLTHLEAKKRRKHKPVQIREGDEITGVAIVAEGRRLLIGTRHGVEVWPWPLSKEGGPLGVLMGHSKHHGRDGGVTAMALTRGDKLLASGGMDAQVCLWDLGSGTPLSVIYQPDEAVRALSFSSDQAMLAYCQHSLPGQQSGIDVVSVPGGKHLVRLPLASHSESVAFNPRYPRLLAFAAETEAVPGRHYGDKPTTQGKVGVAVLGR